MASEEEDQDLESLRVAVLASLKPKSQQASPTGNDADSQGIDTETEAAAGEEKTEDAEEDEQDEDALRRAALKSTKEIRLEDIPPPPPPQPTFQLKGNLIAIQPVPEEPPSAPLNPNERPKLPRSNKFARFVSSSSETSSEEDVDSSEDESGDEEEVAKTGNHSDSSKGSSSSSDESSSSSQPSDRSSGSSSESRSSSSSSSSSYSSSSSSSSSDSSDSDSGDSDRKWKPERKSRKNSHRSSDSKRHSRHDRERHNQQKDRGNDRKSERSHRDQSRERFTVSPGRDRRDRWQRTSNIPGDDPRDYRINSRRSMRDGDNLRPRSRSPYSKANKRELRTRPDGTRGFGPSLSHTQSQSLESRLRRLAAHDSEENWNRNARESASNRGYRSGENRKESTGRRRSSLESKSVRSDAKVPGPKSKHTSSGSDSDSSSGSDISLSDLESESDKETSRFKHAKGEKPPNELDLHPRRIPRSYRDRSSRDDRHDRRENDRRRDLDRHRNDRRHRENDKTRSEWRDRGGPRKYDIDKQRDATSRSRNGPTSVIQSKTSTDVNTKKEPIPSLLDIRIPNPNIDTKARPDLPSTFRREPKNTIRDRVGDNLTSPDRLKHLQKRFESESESDSEKIQTGPRSVVKMDKRGDLKSRLGVRAPAKEQHGLNTSRQKTANNNKQLLGKMAEKDTRKRRSLEPRGEKPSSKTMPDCEDSQTGDCNPKIHITFNEVPPSQRKPIYQRLGVKEAAGPKPRRSVKDRLGKKVPAPKEEDFHKQPKHSLPEHVTYSDDDLLEDRQHVKTATKPRQSVIELKAQTKRDAERKRQAVKNREQMESQTNVEANQPVGLKRAQKTDQKQLEVNKKTKDLEISQDKTQDAEAGSKRISNETEQAKDDVVERKKSPVVHENKEEKEHAEENNKHKDSTKSSDSKPRNRIKLKRRSSRDGQKDIGAKDKDAEVEDTRVYSSSRREEDEIISDGFVIRSVSPHIGRNVIAESDKPRRNVLSTDSNISDRQIVYSSSDKSSRNVIPGDTKTSKRKIIRQDSEMLEQSASEASHRKILHDDSGRTHRKVYQTDPDSSRRKIVHDDPPKRKILQGDHESSKRKVFQEELDCPRRTIVKQDMKRRPSPSSSFEDIRRPKLSRGGELWRRGCIEEQSREVEMRMEQEERKVIEETKEAKAKRLKEEALNARIRKIKEKNAAILERHKEIEAEKIMFGS